MVAYQNDQRLEHHRWQAEIAREHTYGVPGTAVFLLDSETAVQELDTYAAAVEDAPSYKEVYNTRFLVPEKLGARANQLIEVGIDRRIIEVTGLHTALRTRRNTKMPYKAVFADFMGNMNSTHTNVKPPPTHTVEVIRNTVRNLADQCILFTNHNKTYRHATRMYDGWKEQTEPLRAYSVFDPIFQLMEEKWGSRNIYSPAGLAQRDISVTPILMMWVARYCHDISVELVGCRQYRSAAGRSKQRFERTAIKIDKTQPFDEGKFYDSIYAHYKSRDIFEVVNQVIQDESDGLQEVQRPVSQPVVKENDSEAKLFFEIAEAHQSLAILYEQLANSHRKID